MQAVAESLRHLSSNTKIPKHFRVWGSEVVVSEPYSIYSSVLVALSFLPQRYHFQAGDERGLMRGGQKKAFR